MINKLKELGLADKEANVYLASLELGEASIQRISKKAKIKRTTAYDIIETLKGKGLMGSIIKDKKHYYFASSPRKFEDKLEEQQKALKRLMPELLAITNLIDKKPRIRFYEGSEGIKQVYMNTLKYPDRPLWAWLSKDIFDISDYDDFADLYVQKRTKSKIWAYVIAADNEKNREYQKKDAVSLRKTKLVKDNDFSLDVEINLYGPNRIGIMSFKEKFGLIIESDKISNTLKSIFDLSWNSLP